jgi:hypothetical protein
MPVKRRKAKIKAHQLTPDVFAAFDAGDGVALSRALKLPPWHASPLDADLAGPAPYNHEGCWAMTRPAALEMRREILAAMKGRPMKTTLQSPDDAIERRKEVLAAGRAQ